MINKFIVTSLCSGLLFACGGDGGDGGDDGLSMADLQGTWLTSSMTAETDADDLVVTRTEQGLGIRGDVIIAGTGNEGTATTRSIILVDNVPAADAEANTTINSIALDGEMLLSTNSDGVSVYTVSLEGNDLTLDLVADDDRITDDNAPKQIALTKLATPWSSAFTSKSYAIASQTYMGQGILTNLACVQVADDEWAIPDFALICDESSICSREIVVKEFSDAGCTDLVAEGAVEVPAYTEASSGEVSVWVFHPDDARSQYESYDIAESSGNLTLTRQECLPSENCGNGSVVSMVLEPK